MLLESVPCPDLAPIIQSGFPFDERVVETVRSYCAPLRDAEVDTVILGCTHYPLVGPMLQRMLGRSVTLITSAAAVARAPSTCSPSAPSRARGRARASTASCAPATSRLPRAGHPLLQMPLGEVAHVEVSEAAAA